MLYASQILHHVPAAQEAEAQEAAEFAVVWKAMQAEEAKLQAPKRAAEKAAAEKVAAEEAAAEKVTAEKAAAEKVVALAAQGILQVRGHGLSVVFSTDGRYIVGNCSFQTYVWDANSGQIMSELEGYNDAQVALSREMHAASFHREATITRSVCGMWSRVSY